GTRVRLLAGLAPPAGSRQPAPEPDETMVLPVEFPARTLAGLTWASLAVQFGLGVSFLPELDRPWLAVAALLPLGLANAVNLNRGRRLQL
ncbi:hypothetical protein WAH63_20905, partial [Acinetobacter baumannii]